MILIISTKCKLWCNSRNIVLKNYEHFAGVTREIRPHPWSIPVSGVYGCGGRHCVLSVWTPCLLRTVYTTRRQMPAVPARHPHSTENILPCRQASDDSLTLTWKYFTYIHVQVERYILLKFNLIIYYLWIMDIVIYKKEEHIMLYLEVTADLKKYMWSLTRLNTTWVRQNFWRRSPD